VSPLRQDLRRVLVGRPRPDVGRAEWDGRAFVVGLVVLCAVFAAGLVVVPDAVGWRLLALVVAVVASQLAERRFRRWRRHQLRTSARLGHGGTSD
jgi:hypothetical protein